MFRRGMRVTHIDKEHVGPDFQGRVEEVEESSGLIMVRWTNAHVAGFNPVRVHNGCYSPEDLLAELKPEVLAVANAINTRWREMKDPKYHTTKEDSNRAFDHQSEIMQTTTAIMDSLKLDGLARYTFHMIACKVD
jgi:hypothetical protein